MLGLCSFLVWCRRYGDDEDKSSRRRSNNSLVIEQSQSVVRGDHPIAFMLPTVSLSEVGSENSDMESLDYHTSRPGSMASLASLTGSNIYSSSSLLSSFSPSGGSPQSLPLRLPQMRQVPRCSSLPPPSLERREEEGSLGRVGIRLTSRRSAGELQVKMMSAQNIPTNYKTRTANISIKIALLPSKLPKFSTTMVEDSLSPEFNEDFSFHLPAEEMVGKVIKLTIYDHDRGGKKVIGFCVVSLEEAGIVGEAMGELVVKEVWLSVKENVEEDLKDLLADLLELSLRYDPDPGRLTLGILQGRICSLPQQDRDFDIYVKVTLFEGRQVIKAKKTHLLTCQDHLQFQEKFSILLPKPYLESVSCVVSLCSKPRYGTKSVMGRTCVGPWTYASGPGLDQWIEMSNKPNVNVVRWHAMA